MSSTVTDGSPSPRNTSSDLARVFFNTICDSSTPREKCEFLAKPLRPVARLDNAFELRTRNAIINLYLLFFVFCILMCDCGYKVFDSLLNLTDTCLLVVAEDLDRRAKLDV